ncbi:MAG: penicillin-binding protein 1C [Treponema sp.]|nr:penicillin-binding protein 1C [Treponema sp.]
MKKVCALVCGTVAFSVLIFFLLLRFLPYPALNAFQSRPISTRIYDFRGNLLQIIPQENGVRREWIPLDEIPSFVKHIFLGAEDRRFYQHHGIDIGAILRASFQNASEMRTVSGASTITMQLARIIRPNANRTIFVKLCEAFNALRLEMRLSKAEILELYLNNVPFGFNAEGVASAARTFFALSIEELTEPQATCLAVIPRRPALYNPLSNPELCAKAAYDLYSSVAEFAESSYTADDFLLAANSAHSFSYPFEMPHFVRWLSQQPESPIGHAREVCTTVDLSLQHVAEDLLARSVERYASNRLTNGSVLVCDTQSGAIRAWVGSTNFFDERHNGQIDGVLTQRQPGSSMKPFLYALALERGYSPSSVLPDIPSEFGFERMYAPQNFNNRFNGPVRLRVALASSLNIPAVHLLNEIGLDSYLQKLRELHFVSLEHADPGLGLALGNAEVSIFELTQAFSVFARDGVFLPLFALASEKTLSKQKSFHVYDTNTARLICDILSDADARAMGFGFAPVFRTPFPSMFKTGTANQFQNITAFGATPQYTVGVWMGNFSGETVVGKTGSSVPAKIARELLVYLQGKNGSPFAKPAQFKKERICALSGLRATEHCPDTVSEYVAAGVPLEDCTWHRNNVGAQGTTSYPAEYAAWFRIKNRSGAVDEKGSPLRITSPRSGSLFYYDASVPASQQKLAVEATGGSDEKADFLLDGKMIAQVTRPFVAYVPIIQGNHTVTVRCGNAQTEIAFSVK